MASLKLKPAHIHFVDYVLIALIIVGTVFRLAYPFYNNPMFCLTTDPGRHYFNALGTGERTYRYLDPLGYQWWLGAYLKFFGTSLIAAAVYTGLLSSITPFCWYLWLRQSLPSKRLALTGWALLAILPSWMGIFAYFMTETLLLPLLGLALWSTWNARNQPKWQNIMLCGFFWAFAMITKFSVAPEAVISLCWLFWQLNKKLSKVFAYRALLSILSLIGVFYLIGVIDTYQGFGTTWLYPPRIAAVTQLYHQSGAKGFKIFVISKTRAMYQAGAFESPAACPGPRLAPFCDWTSHRIGIYNVIIDGNELPRVFADSFPMSLATKLRFLSENVVNFFFDRSWPDCNSSDLVQLYQVNMHWLWSIIFLSVICMAIKKENWNILVILCLGTALMTCVQEQSLMEGRYRKPWEGVAIASFLSLIACKGNKEKTPVRNSINQIF